jgi:hypothetical protein|tara:strand:+ start:375 stop:935 length:561 start_codon:yes stop_codon:yes gene_type:complete
MPNKNSGIFTNTTKIVDVVVRYNVKEDWQKREDDICITLTLPDIEKKDGTTFTPRPVTIGGYFNRKDDGSILNNGTVTKIKILFECAGLNWDESVTEDKQHLTDEAVEELQGKEVCMLKYIYGTTSSGNTGWSTWNEVGKVGDDEKLKEKFLKAVENKWVKDFRPDEGSDSFNTSEFDKNSGGYQL